jgi:hypothetical protein
MERAMPGSSDSRHASVWIHRGAAQRVRVNLEGGRLNLSERQQGSDERE